MVRYDAITEHLAADFDSEIQISVISLSYFNICVEVEQKMKLPTG